MNTRVLVVDEGAGRALALLAAAALAGEPVVGGVPMDSRLFGDDEEPARNLGYMEFFDWAAKTSFEEMVTVWNTYNQDSKITLEDARNNYNSPKLREDFAIATWECL